MFNNDRERIFIPNLLASDPETTRACELWTYILNAESLDKLITLLSEKFEIIESDASKSDLLKIVITTINSSSKSKIKLDTEWFNKEFINGILSYQKFCIDQHRTNKEKNFYWNSTIGKVTAPTVEKLSKILLDVNIHSYFFPARAILKSSKKGVKNV